MKKILLLVLLALVSSNVVFAEQKFLWQSGEEGLEGTSGKVPNDYEAGLILAPDKFKGFEAGMKLNVSVKEGKYTQIYFKSYDDGNPSVYPALELGESNEERNISVVLTTFKLKEISNKGLRIDASVGGTEITKVWIETEKDAAEDYSDAIWTGSQTFDGSGAGDVVRIFPFEAAELKEGDTLKIYFGKNQDDGYVYVNPLAPEKSGGYGLSYDPVEWKYTKTGAEFVIDQKFIDMLRENGNGFVVKGVGVTVTRVDKFRIDWANLKIDDVKIEVWEGPLYEAFEEGWAHFKKSETLSNDRRDIWELEVVGEDGTPKIDSYVSQFDLSVAFKGGDQYVFVDAHTTDTYVDAYSKFWCQNSRMEPGVGIKKIYFIYDRDAQFNESKKETPFQFMFSSDGEFHYKAFRQQPFNSDTYAIRLSEGEVYNALKGTQSGTIDIPFIRHHIAKEGFSINLGKEVTIKDKEQFRLLVKDHNAKVHFNLDKVYKEGDPAHQPISGDAVSTIDGTADKDGLTFNKIVLMVGQNKTTGAFDQYTMYLLDKNEEPVDYIFNGYELDEFGSIDRDSQKNPKLKIWEGGDSEWKDLNAKWKELNGKDRGTVRLFDIKPVLTSTDGVDAGVAKKTNIYYLPLPGGVKVGGRNGNHSDMFNFIDNEGYDISNPYQGSQVIYPNEWWCINPSLGFKKIDELKEAYPGVSNIRELDGFYFPPLPEKLGLSEVDLSWGVTANTPHASLQDGSQDVYETTIYGITLFKIMGYGYDVYAKTFKERPLYYIYAETDEEKAKDYEKTAPIVLQVNDASSVEIQKEIAVNGEVYEEPKKFIPSENNPTLLKRESNSTRYYQLGLSQVQLTGNDDLNWLLCDDATGAAVKNIRFVPNSSQSITFVDVTGRQTWDAYGNADKLTANTWSNYYSTYDDDANDLQIDQFGNGTEYFRLVLATNPDAARYQILTKESKVEGKMNYRYLSQNKIDMRGESFVDGMGYPTSNDENAIWIYPTVKLNGNFLIANDTDNITVELENHPLVTIGGVRLEDEKDEDSAYLVDSKGNRISGKVNLIKKTDAFLEPGEYIFNYDLGEYFVNPESTSEEGLAGEESGRSLIAKVSYGPSKEISTEIKVLGIDVPGIDAVRVPYHSSESFGKPIYLTGFSSYHAQLVWTNEENPAYDGLPRTYTVSGKETKSFRGDGHGNEQVLDQDILHKGYIHNNNVFTYDSNSCESELNDGTEWFSTHEMPTYFSFDDKGNLSYNCFTYRAHDDCKASVNGHVVIEYSVTPTYHFALPSSETELSEVPQDMTELFRNGPQNNGKTRAASDFYAVTLHGEPAVVPVEYGDNMATGINGVTMDLTEREAVEELYTLQGVKVNGQPEPGVYIVRKGAETRKVFIR